MRIALLICCALRVSAPAVGTPLQAATAIDEYVRTHDPSYRWQLVSTKTEEGLTHLIVEFVSQRWLTPSEVDKPEWRHWLTIAVPDRVVSDVGLLFIGGGSNGRAAPDRAGAEVTAVARATSTVAAELRMVPNQPLIFHNDGQPRWEDDLIGYAWAQYLQSGEARWLPRNAMVKAAVRAMDTVTAAVASQETPNRVDRFVVAGASKRGWTTWLTGAMDERVIAIAPIVIDVLNAGISMRHHFAAYGFWAASIGNYVDHGIMQELDNPRLADLYQLGDPWHYRHRLHMPMFIVNSSGDQFFLPDSSRFYLNGLRGETYLRYVPNADHSLEGSDALAGLVAFHAMIAQGQKPPQFSWRWDDATLMILTNDVPASVTLWQAHNSTARDFRLETLGRQYVAASVAQHGPGIYAIQVEVPESGWTAAFAELEYALAGDMTFKLSTDVRVFPDVLPHASRPPHLPASVTLSCVPTDRDGADKMLRGLGRSLQREGVASRTHTASARERVYLNWTPAKSLYVGGREIREQLNAAGCKAIHVQLESGKKITLPDLARP